MMEVYLDCIRPIRKGTDLEIAAHALAFIANDLRQGRIDEATQTATVALEAIDFDKVIIGMQLNEKPTF
ncbi:hypothetical protein Nhal_0960 [Nitrosococcus halophilus Nc 4]|uniref:Uncharacterized protein n=1 Tax=Nitrosococcus halophilus (strain Nc4) TaxID=472759 RepID=D5BYF0_NITHN|nr:hypothetical protein [Nitrosococcus halophilus]ADE14133.1 hypothetical protein Nhal_0960 [Nitrosococcus halophilus Nc 4]